MKPQEQNKAKASYQGHAASPAVEPKSHAAADVRLKPEDKSRKDMETAKRAGGEKEEPEFGARKGSYGSK